MSDGDFNVKRSGMSRGLRSRRFLLFDDKRKRRARGGKLADFLIRRKTDTELPVRTISRSNPVWISASHSSPAGKLSIPTTVFDPVATSSCNSPTIDSSSAIDSQGDSVAKSSKRVVFPCLAASASVRVTSVVRPMPGSARSSNAPDSAIRSNSCSGVTRCAIKKRDPVCPDSSFGILHLTSHNAVSTPPTYQAGLDGIIEFDV